MWRKGSSKGLKRHIVHHGCLRSHHSATGIGISGRSRDFGQPLPPRRRGVRQFFVRGNDFRSDADGSILAAVKLLEVLHQAPVLHQIHWKTQVNHVFQQGHGPRPFPIPKSCINEDIIDLWKWSNCAKWAGHAVLGGLALANLYKSTPKLCIRPPKEFQPQGPCWHRGAHAVTYWIPDSTLRISAPTWLLSWQYVSIYVIIFWLNDVPRRGVHNYYICACKYVKYVKYMRAIILYVSVPYLKHVRTLSTNNPKVNCNDQKAKVTSRLMSSDETLLLATNPSSKASTFGHLEQHPRNLLPILFFPNISKAPPRIWKKAPQPNFLTNPYVFY